MFTNSSRPVHLKTEINLSFYFHTFFDASKGFMKAFEGLHTTFCGTEKKCESENISQFFLFVRDRGKKA